MTTVNLFSEQEKNITIVTTSQTTVSLTEENINVRPIIGTIPVDDDNVTIITNEPYVYYFNQNFLVGNNLTVNLPDTMSDEAPSVAIYDDLNDTIMPSNVEVSGISTLIISLEGFTPITGTWRLRIL